MYYACYGPSCSVQEPVVKVDCYTVYHLGGWFLLCMRIVEDYLCGFRKMLYMLFAMVCLGRSRNK